MLIGTSIPLRLTDLSALSADGKRLKICGVFHQCNEQGDGRPYRKGAAQWIGELPVQYIHTAHYDDDEVRLGYGGNEVKYYFWISGRHFAPLTSKHAVDIELDKLYAEM